MNEDSLFIHSFLMHNDIPFQRYFHAGCRTHKEWLATVKKLNARCTPAFTCFEYSMERSLFFMRLFAAGNDEKPLMSGLGSRELAALEVLRCSSDRICTLSPLSLVFDSEHQFCLSVDSFLLNEQRLCLPCADATESVVINTEDFIRRFIPAAGISFAG